MADTKKNSNISDEQAMREVMALMDAWEAPDPSPWFDARMMARFREEQERAPQGIFARMRDRFLFGNTASMKPMLAGAMALLLVVGGGSYFELSQNPVQHHKPAVSAAVEDLQIIDNNAQAIQQMGQLLDDNGDGQPQS